MKKEDAGACICNLTVKNATLLLAAQGFDAAQIASAMVNEGIALMRAMGIAPENIDMLLAGYIAKHHTPKVPT